MIYVYQIISPVVKNNLLVKGMEGGARLGMVDVYRQTGGDLPARLRFGKARRLEGCRRFCIPF